MDTFGEHEIVASATECTGLMAALPQTMAEDENQAEMYGIHSAKKKDRKKCEAKGKKRR